MCLNCGLISPILDSTCKRLNIETGKYLARGYEVERVHVKEFNNLSKKIDDLQDKLDTGNYILSFIRKYFLDSLKSDREKMIHKTYYNLAVNYTTGMSFNYDSLVEDKEIEVDGYKIQLYTGKIVQNKDDSVQYYFPNTFNSSSIRYLDERFHVINNPQYTSCDLIDEQLEKMYNERSFSP